jgi:hypothetical protein
MPPRRRLPSSFAPVTRYPLTTVVGGLTVLMSAALSLWLDSHRTDATRRYRWWPWLDRLHYDPSNPTTYDALGRRVLPVAKRLIWGGLAATALAYAIETVAAGP